MVASGCGDDSSGGDNTDARETSPTQSPSQTEPSSDIVGDYDVGEGRHLHLQCIGSGEPTIVLEVGGEDTVSGSWGSVYSPMESISRVCSYDRANLGMSDPDPGPRTTKDLADDLVTLLHVAEVPGPYVFVGGSLGGNIIGLVAANHPKEVAGLVFVDSTPTNVDPELDPFRKNLSAKEYKRCCDPSLYTPDFDAPENVEHIDWKGSLAAELASVRHQPKVPTIVLSATRLDCEPSWPCEAIIKDDGRLQGLWIKGNPKGSQQFIDSGHVMQREAPQAIIDATRTVVEAVSG